MTVLTYRDHGFIRIFCTRTGETLFEIKMLGGVDGLMAATRNWTP